MAMCRAAWWGVGRVWFGGKEAVIDMMKVERNETAGQAGARSYLLYSRLTKL